MNIVDIITEEAQKLFENLEVYTIHDLALMLKRLPDVDDISLEIIEKLLMDEYRKGGDQAVIDMYQQYAGVEIEALRNGRYVFANLNTPRNYKAQRFVNEEIKRLFGDSFYEEQELHEIIDTKDIYPWTRHNVGDNGEIGYQFKTEDDVYLVFMGKDWIDDIYADDYNEFYWVINFRTRDGDFGDVINKGNGLKVLSTIVDIIKNFFETEKPTQIIISPWGTEGGYGYDNRRYNIYVNLLKRNLPPGYKLNPQGSYDGKIYVWNPSQKDRYIGIGKDDLIMEIGEGGKHVPYDWREQPAIAGNVGYEFETEDGDQYEVQMQDLNNYWNIDFKTKTGNFEDVINKGRFFRVMATIAATINDFLIKESPELIRISPAKNSNADQRRFNIYKQYFEKQLPKGYHVYPSGGYIFVQKADEMEYFEEGTGDRYAQKQFGIPDSGEEFEAGYQQHLKSQQQHAGMGEKVGEFETETYVRGKEGVVDGSSGDFIRTKAIASIYKNPKNFDGFDPSVRAISTENGDFYVADINGDFTHSEMGMKVFGESVYKIQKYVTWYRIKDSNNFRFASVADSQYRELMQGRFPEHFYERFVNGIAVLRKRYRQSKFYIVGDTELKEGTGDRYVDKEPSNVNLEALIREETLNLFGFPSGVEEQKLMEIGEANVDPYPWDKQNTGQNKAMYQFVAQQGSMPRRDGILYEVVFQKGVHYEYPDYWYGAFQANGYSDDETTDANELQKVMATITDIMKAFVNEYEPEKVIFEPSKTSEKDQRRLRLYMAYIQKNLPQGYQAEIGTAPNGGQIIVVEKLTDFSL